MRRLDIVRNAVKKAKKKLKNIDYIRQHNIVRPSDVIYELDIRSLMHPRDAEIKAYPILDWLDDTCHGICVEHVYYDGGRYKIVNEFFNLDLPKEFKDQEY